MSGTGHVTTNLKLHVPVFDQSPWDVDVNTNWNILDAAVGQFVAIPNLAGVWSNSHTYTLGQSAIDNFDSSIWYCLQTHTSPPPPTIFSADRAINPARWTQTSAGANFYAQQAANSALAAANSAQEAKDAVDGVTGMVPLAGGIMTGPLILNDDPTDPLGSAPKRYVDARVGGVGFLPLTGGTLTGWLEVGGAGIRYTSTASGDRHYFGFGWSGTYPYLTVDGGYQGAIATREFLVGNYLPLSGGNLGGSISVIGNIQVSQSFWVTSNGAKFNSNAGITQLIFSDANWRLAQTNTTGQLQYIRGYDGVSLFSFGGDGTNIFAGTLKVNGALETDGSLFARQGTVFWGVDDQSKLLTDNSTFTNIYFLQNYYFSLNYGSGTLTYYNPSAPGGSLTLDYDGGVGNRRASVYGNGVYINISDERMKTNILPLVRGLKDIMLLEPIVFRRIGNETEEEEGFSAQQVQTVLPSAVRVTYDDLLGVSLDPIVAALVNGMKEMATRIGALENKS